MNIINLSHPIYKDSYVENIMKTFDLNETHFSSNIKNNIILPELWNIGLIYGPSGSGKSTLLSTFGKTNNNVCDLDKPIISQLYENIDESVKLLSSIGLNSIPSWIKPVKYLSNGELFRCNLAKNLAENSDLCLIDEFTSVVDRNVAQTCSFALQKYIRKNNKKIILSSCHEDIIEWLNPDWIYNPIIGETLYPRGQLQRPRITLQIEKTHYKTWDYFKQHHYLTDKIHRSSRCFVVYWENKLVGFTAILPLPNPNIKNAWREHRTVILPDFQGISLGCKISDYFGSLIKSQNGSYYSRTQNPAMINYRMKSQNWQFLYSGTRKTNHTSTWDADFIRPATSFKYIGPSSTIEEGNLFWQK